MEVQSSLIQVAGYVKHSALRFGTSGATRPKLFVQEFDHLRFRSTNTGNQYPVFATGWGILCAHELRETMKGTIISFGIAVV